MVTARVLSSKPSMYLKIAMHAQRSQPLVAQYLMDSAQMGAEQANRIWLQGDAGALIRNTLPQLMADAIKSDPEMLRDVTDAVSKDKSLSKTEKAKRISDFNAGIPEPVEPAVIPQ